MNGIEKPCTGTHGCTREEPHTHRFLSMADRVPNGEPINDAIAAAQARDRAERAAELAEQRAERAFQDHFNAEVQP